MKKQRQSEVRKALSPNSESVIAQFKAILVIFVLIYIFAKTPILNVISKNVLQPIRDSLMPVRP